MQDVIHLLSHLSKPKKKALSIEFITENSDFHMWVKLGIWDLAELLFVPEMTDVGS